MHISCKSVLVKSSIPLLATIRLYIDPQKNTIPMFNAEDAYLIRSCLRLRFYELFIENLKSLIIRARNG